MSCFLSTMSVNQHAVLPRWHSSTATCSYLPRFSKPILQHQRAWLPASASCQAAPHRVAYNPRLVATHAAATDEIAQPVQVPSQFCDSPIPPIGRKITTLQQVEDGMWVFDQDFISTDPSTDIRSNAFLIRMNDGTLMLTSVSISLTEEARALLETIPEPVGHIVINAISPEHWIYLPQWLSVFPDATVWAMPGTQAASTFYGRFNPAADSWKKVIEQCRRSDGSPADIRIVENNAQPEEFKGDVTFCQYYSKPAWFGETTLHIASRRVIVMADLAFARKKEDVEKAAWFWRKMAELSKVDGRLGSFIFPVLLSNKDKALAWRNKVLSLEFDRVLCSHFTPVVPNGKQQFKECFKFLG